MSGKEIIEGKFMVFLQQSSLPSLMNFYNGNKKKKFRKIFDFLILILIKFRGAAWAFTS
jgi:hypothetical protein